MRAPSDLLPDLAVAEHDEDAACARCARRALHGAEGGVEQTVTVDVTAAGDGKPQAPVSGRAVHAPQPVVPEREQIDAGLGRRGQRLRRAAAGADAGGDMADTNSLIIEIRAGTGGDEAALFARDLYDMYTKYATKKGWKIETMDLSPTERGGFREAVFSIQGDSAYQELQFESGGHRVQRVPETEAQGRIHTSAATVAVLLSAVPSLALKVNESVPL